MSLLPRVSPQGFPCRPMGRVWEASRTLAIIHSLLHLFAPFTEHSLHVRPCVLVSVEVLQRHKTNRILCINKNIWICIKRLITRNWFMWYGDWDASGSGEQMVLSSSPSPSPKAGEDSCLSLKTSRESAFSLAQIFVLFRPPRDYMKPTHTWEDNVLYSV